MTLLRSAPRSWAVRSLPAAVPLIAATAVAAVLLAGCGPSAAPVAQAQVSPTSQSTPSGTQRTERAHGGSSDAAARQAELDGLRLIGRGGYAIGVPRTWPYRAQGVCGVGSGPSSVSLGGRIFAVPCPALPGSRQPRIEVDAARGAAHGHAVRTLADGATVRASGSPRSSAGLTWRVGDVAFVVTGRLGPGLKARLLASITSVPRGYVAVPLWPLRERDRPRGVSIGPAGPATYRRLLRDAGLVPGRGPVIGSLRDRRVTRPEQGAIVRIGSVVGVARAGRVR